MGKLFAPPKVLRERRREIRWLDRRLLTLRTVSAEFPGLTADLSLSGLRLGVACRPALLGKELEVAIAFAQEVLEVRGRPVYTRQRTWGALIGIRFEPGQEHFRRFLARRYPPAETDSGHSPKGPRPTLPEFSPRTWVLERPTAAAARLRSPPRGSLKFFTRYN